MPDTVPTTGEVYALRTVVIDTRSNKVGEVRGMEAGRYYVRPLCGGREWEVPQDKIRRMTPDEVMKARLDLKNRRSSGPREPSAYHVRGVPDQE